MTWVGLLQPVEGLDRTKTDPLPPPRKKEPCQRTGSGLGLRLLPGLGSADLSRGFGLVSPQLHEPVSLCVHTSC